MINVIWASMLLIGVVVGIATGNVDAVTEAAVESAKTGVEISLGLIGVMALWLGLMKIAQDSGFVNKLAQWLKPIMVRLFPDVPADHPAMGAIIMSIAANMLGLGNAATPLGLLAMKELDTLNEHKGIATNAMVMLMALETSSVTLIPINTINFLNQSGGTNTTNIIGPTIVSTITSTVVAIAVAKFLQNREKYKVENFINTVEVD